MPMMPIQGMVSHPNPQTLRITLGNIIAHSENCPMCMNYIAHMAMANDFNDAITQCNNIIRNLGASSSSSIPSSCNHEPLISSLQEQIASANRTHEVERQMLNDRIAAFELERSELCSRIDEDEIRIKRIVRDGDAVDDERHYWKNKYYDLAEGVEQTHSQANSPENQPKSTDKGKGREVPTVPLRRRLASPDVGHSRGSLIPLSQRMSPMDDVMEPFPSTEEPPTMASTSEASTTVKLPKPTVFSKPSPHSGEKRKRNESTGTPSRRDVVPYDDLYPRDRLDPSYKPGEDARALQNKTNKEVKRKWHEED
ncbi:hypothetical protein FB446DRAFT_710264, partial [Lentinula raphanica]